MLPECPPELNFMLPFLQRSSELEAANHPIMAFYCIYYAVSMALQRKYAKSPTTDKFISALFDRLEQAKGELSEHAVMKDSRQAATFVREFAYRVFLSADTEDKNLLPSSTLQQQQQQQEEVSPIDIQSARKVLQKYLAAVHFLQVYRGLFLEAVEAGSEEAMTAEQVKGEIEQVEEKSKYAKWRVLEIKKMMVEATAAGGNKGQQFQESKDNGTLATTTATTKQSIATKATVTATTAANTNTIHAYATSTNMAKSTTVQSTANPTTRNANITSPTSPTSPNVSVTSPSVSSISHYSPKVLSECEKHARYAISALQFDDIPTAVKNLQEALDLIKPLVSERK